MARPTYECLERNVAAWYALPGVELINRAVNLNFIDGMAEVSGPSDFTRSINLFWGEIFGD